jgi:hypothetical protein
MIQNYWTTITGFASGFLFYVASNGANFPSNKQEWLNFLVAASLAGLGLTAKSATVGSKPLKLIPIGLALLLSGCAGAFGASGVDAAQLHEIAKVKDATATCIRGVYLGAVVTILSINADKGIPAGIIIKDSCEVTFSTIPPKP